jgi:hypothetical protein
VLANRLNEALAATESAAVAGRIERRIRPVSVLMLMVPPVLLALFFVFKPPG